MNTKYVPLNLITKVVVCELYGTKSVVPDVSKIKAHFGRFLTEDAIKDVEYRIEMQNAREGVSR